MYRVNGLDWAKQWAQNTSRSGARYPWQTAAAGKIASFANEAEIHIVGDVALSMWQYFSATHNTTWLKDHGLKVLAGTAEFFAGAFFDCFPTDSGLFRHCFATDLGLCWHSMGKAESRRLVLTEFERGPNAFHTGDDSCYVNAAAARNLRSAANFSALLGQVRDFALKEMDFVPKTVDLRLKVMDLLLKNGGFCSGSLPTGRISRIMCGCRLISKGRCTLNMQNGMTR